MPTTTLQRSGDELALLFDPAWARQFGLVEDTQVRVSVQAGMLRIDPVEPPAADDNLPERPETDGPDQTGRP